MTYLLATLQSRYAPLDEETRLASMTKMLAFARKPNESINDLLARYEVVRDRAATDGQFVMSTEGMALQLLRACGVRETQLMFLLNPFNGMLPRTQDQLDELIQNLRRQGHIHEHAPGNIAQVLQGPFQQAQSGTYFGDRQGDTLFETHARGQTNAYPSMQAYPVNAWNNATASASLAQQARAPWADANARLYSEEGWWRPSPGQD